MCSNINRKKKYKKNKKKNGAGFFKKQKGMKKVFKVLLMLMVELWDVLLKSSY